MIVLVFAALRFLVRFNVPNAPHWGCLDLRRFVRFAMCRVCGSGLALAGCNLRCVNALEVNRLRPDVCWRL